MLTSRTEGASHRPLPRKEAEKRKQSSDDEDGGAVVGEDGYLHHSDSEADWSDVEDDLYQSKKRSGISEKEARRRRAWASGDDAATAAGRAWPAFPRNVVRNVLSTVLDEAIKYDQSKGGLFSVPVPRDEIPEYYDMITNPMDYGTMKEKLDNGEYRSAQAMQKDFTLIMRNCLKFNEKDSEIVSEARQQALLRPGMLRDAAMKHSLFIAEDGSVLEVYSEADAEADGNKKKGRRKRKKGDEEPEEGEKDEIEAKKPRKRRKQAAKKAQSGAEEMTAETDPSAGNDDPALSTLNKPRIRISLSKKAEGGGKNSKKRKKKGKSAEQEEASDDGNKGDDEKTPAPKRKKRKTGTTPAPRGKEGAPASAKNKSGTKKRKKKVPDEHASAALDDPGPPFGDVNFWKVRREALDGSFDAARNNFSDTGPWRLPLPVQGSFARIALDTLDKMDSHDNYSIFEKSVTESEAPGYYDVVKDPMDFGTMRKKVENGDYGDGQDAIVALFNDLLLVFDNCRLYNEDGGDVMEEATRVFGLLPETLAEACANAAKRKK